MRVTFNEVKIHSEKTIICNKCKKRLKRRKKFYQTLNPFNKNKEGLPKTAEEIKSELYIVEAKWRKETEKCSSCPGTMKIRTSK